MQKTLLMLIAAYSLVSNTVFAQTVKSTVLVDDLAHPWGMAFLPNGDILITERIGRLRLVKDGKLLVNPIKGLPTIKAKGQGGLLDIVLHPDYTTNGWLYFSYAEPGVGGYGTTVSRARLKDEKLVDLQHIFRMNKKSRGGRHFGSRLLFDRGGYLYITVGDRGDKERAQRLDDHAGTVIRLHDDGRIPDDNPFAKNSKSAAEIFSYGHRNPQGIALNPKTGKVWIHEHGPQGGDELNVISAGNNYGWPVITYGVNYVIATQIGEGTHKQGMEQPLYYWVPSIAPSGMTFYNGDLFPAWKNSLFIGSLKFQLLVRLALDGGKIVKEERLFEGEFGRIRDVHSDRQGYLYLLTDESDGQLIRLEPK